MNKKTWALLFFTYAIVLIVTAPASLISQLLSYASNGRVELANTRGTIWAGSANPVLHQKNGGLITINSLHWSISPLTLLTGKLNAQINWDIDQIVPPMYINVSAKQIELQHTYIPLPAILLDEASDFLKPAVLRGQIILKSDSLLISNQGLQGTATADWLNASSLLSSVSPLGDYHFTFSSSPASLDITLQTTSGALILSGQGRFTAGSGLDFKGTAQAAKGKEAELHELLSNLGPEVSPGVNSFSLVPTAVH
jgi:general secretion pathway protein N